ncbi:hypothetical protein F4804DRAFT_102336 [Jackrogersella minutella]|nr:hypothetical protein F4804DRAFT_102336 [Jackrogersella minutella]
MSSKVSENATKANPGNHTKQPSSQTLQDDRFLMFARSARNFQTFVSFLMPISIFGASIFSIILGQMTDPKDISDTPIFSLATVRAMLALAWLCFVLVLGIGGLSLGFLLTHEENSQGALKPEIMRNLRKLGLAAVVLLYSLTIGGFMLMAIALAAYVQVVAFIAVSCTAIAGIVAMVVCFYQWQ